MRLATMLKDIRADNEVLNLETGVSPNIFSVVTEGTSR